MNDNEFGAPACSVNRLPNVKLSEFILKLTCMSCCLFREHFQPQSQDPYPPSSITFRLISGMYFVLYISIREERRKHYF